MTPRLAELLEAPATVTRPEVVKLMWAYIRSKNLQNPKDKREILLDDPGLMEVFKVKKFTMFTMNRHLSKHLWAEEEVQEEKEVETKPKAKKKAAPKKASAGKGNGKKDAASASKKVRVYVSAPHTLTLNI